MHTPNVLICTPEFRQPAGIGAPVHRFCHLSRDGSVSFANDVFFKRTQGGEPFLRKRHATLTTRGAQAFEPGHHDTLGGTRQPHPEPPVYKHKDSNLSRLIRIDRCNREGGAVGGGRIADGKFYGFKDLKRTHGINIF